MTNKFIGFGFLGSDPKIINKGCILNLAIRTKKTEEPLWMSVFVFGKLADLCLEYKNKGDKILVDGYLEKTPDGNIVIVANDIGFL